MDIAIDDEFSTFQQFHDVIQKRTYTLGEKWVKGKNMRTVKLANSKIKKTDLHYRPDFEYSNIEMVCVHGGQWRSRGVKLQTSSSKIGCPAAISLVAKRKEDKLRVVKCDLNHNHALFPPFDVTRVRGKSVKFVRKEIKDSKIELKYLTGVRPPPEADLKETCDRLNQIAEAKDNGNVPVQSGGGMPATSQDFNYPDPSCLRTPGPINVNTPQTTANNLSLYPGIPSTVSYATALPQGAAPSTFIAPSLEYVNPSNMSEAPGGNTGTPKKRKSAGTTTKKKTPGTSTKKKSSKGAASKVIINEDLARSVSEVLTNGMNSETLAFVQKEVKMPQNCEKIKVVPISTEVGSAVKVKKGDRDLQSVHGLLMQTLSALTQVMTALGAKMQANPEIDLLSNGIGLCAQAAHQLDICRQKHFKPTIQESGPSQPPPPQLQPQPSAQMTNQEAYNVLCTDHKYQESGLSFTHELGYDIHSMSKSIPRAQSLQTTHSPAPMQRSYPFPGQIWHQL